MESVINKLAEIETAATKIMQAAENQKKLQDEQQEERIATMQIWKRKRQSGLKRSQQNFILLQMRIRKSSGLCRRTSIFTGRLLRTESRNTVHADLRKHYKEVKR